LFPEILDLKKSSTKKVGLILSLETIFKKIDPVNFFLAVVLRAKKNNKKKYKNICIYEIVV
jgi:hypothetical protein